MGLFDFNWDSSAPITILGDQTGTGTGFNTQEFDPYGQLAFITNANPELSEKQSLHDWQPIVQGPDGQYYTKQYDYWKGDFGNWTPATEETMRTAPGYDSTKSLEEFLSQYQKNYALRNMDQSGMSGFMNQAAPLLWGAAMAAGTGGALSGLGAGAIGTGVGAGAIGGASTTAFRDPSIDWDKIGQSAVLGGTMGGVTAGIAPTISGYTQSMLPAGTPSIVGQTLGGATSGAVVGGTVAGLTDRNIGEAALIGGMSGAITGAMTPAMQELSTTLQESGINPAAATSIARTMTGTAANIAVQEIKNGNIDPLQLASTAINSAIAGAMNPWVDPANRDSADNFALSGIKYSGPDLTAYNPNDFPVDTGLDMSDMEMNEFDQIASSQDPFKQVQDPNYQLPYTTPTTDYKIADNFSDIGLNPPSEDWMYPEYDNSIQGITFDQTPGLEGILETDPLLPEGWKDRFQPDQELIDFGKYLEDNPTVDTTPLEMSSGIKMPTINLSTAPQRQVSQQLQQFGPLGSTTIAPPNIQEQKIQGVKPTWMSQTGNLQGVGNIQAPKLNVGPNQNALMTNNPLQSYNQFANKYSNFGW